MKKVIFLLIFTITSTLYAQDIIRHKATVIETMNSGGYTYMKVDEKGKQYWVAVTQTEVKPSDAVMYQEQMWLKQFKSTTLNREFDTILFASMAPKSAYGKAPVSTHTKTIHRAFAPEKAMKKLADGQSVQEVFEKRASLKDTRVTVRGVVTKISQGIMGKNWVHIEDGTGNESTNDLVFTTKDTLHVKPGDTVIASGTAITDKDFGYGYYYPVIIEKSDFKPSR